MGRSGKSRKGKSNTQEVKDGSDNCSSPGDETGKTRPVRTHAAAGRSGKKSVAKCANSSSTGPKDGKCPLENEVPSFTDRQKPICISPQTPNPESRCKSNEDILMALSSSNPCASSCSSSKGKDPKTEDSNKDRGPTEARPSQVRKGKRLESGFGDIPEGLDQLLKGRATKKVIGTLLRDMEETLPSGISIDRLEREILQDLLKSPSSLSKSDTEGERGKTSGLPPKCDSASSSSHSITDTLLSGLESDKGGQRKEQTRGPCSTCGAESEVRCSGCRLVFYCDKECQRNNWKEHRNVCRPFTIGRWRNYDRCLVASRDIGREDLILQESPLFLSPKQVTEPVCLSCYRRVDGSYRCSKCTWPLCSSTCEYSDDHKAECSLTRCAEVFVSVADFSSPQNIYEVIPALRCMTFASMFPKKWKTFVDRFHNQSKQLSTSPQHDHNQEVVVPLLRNYFRAGTTLGVDDGDESLHTVLGVFQWNSVPTKVPYAEVSGLYPNCSLLAHSCAPNTKLQWEAVTRKLLVYATEPIVKGQPLTTIYTDILWGTMSRRDHLLKSRLISCDCRRCRDPTELGTYFSALICRKCPRRTPMLSKNSLDNSSPFACTKCSFELSPQDVMETNLALGAVATEALSSPSVENLERIQKEWLPIVHSNHYHLHAIKHTLLQLYGRAQEKEEEKNAAHWEEIQKKEKACRDFLQVCSLLDPSMANTVHFVALTFYEYHKTIIQNAKRNFGLAKLDSQQLKKRMLLAKALLKKAMEFFSSEPEDTMEGQLFLTCQEEAKAITDWMFAVGLI